MPIGIVTDDDFQAELEHLSGKRKVVPSTRPTDSQESNVIEGTIIDKPARGRKEGDVNVPDSLRKIIGETSVIDGREEALKLARMFDISPSQVSAYANGATSTASYNSPTQSIIKHINKSRARAIKKASHVMNGAMSAITQEKLDYADPKDLSTIAKDMSAIIKNLEPPAPPVDPDAGTRPQFVIFAPSFKREEHYETINVTE
jgi:carbamate kinase